MKTGNTNYNQDSRCIWDTDHKDISLGAKCLFFFLNELETRYGTEKTGYAFTRTDKQICDELNISLRSMFKYKKELKDKASDLVSITTTHIEYSDGAKSTQPYTCYRILK